MRKRDGHGGPPLPCWAAGLLLVTGLLAALAAAAVTLAAGAVGRG